MLGTSITGFVVTMLAFYLVGTTLTKAGSFDFLLSTSKFASKDMNTRFVDRLQDYIEFSQVNEIQNQCNVLRKTGGDRGALKEKIKEMQDFFQAPMYARKGARAVGDREFNVAGIDFEFPRMRVVAPKYESMIREDERRRRPPPKDKGGGDGSGGGGGGGKKPQQVMQFAVNKDTTLNELKKWIGAHGPVPDTLKSSDMNRQNNKRISEVLTLNDFNLIRKHLLRTTDKLPNKLIINADRSIFSSEPGGAGVGGGDSRDDRRGRRNRRNRGGGGNP